VEYLQELRQRHPERSFIGGVIIEDRNVWRFSKHHLENDFRELDGWDSFDPTLQTEGSDFDETMFRIDDSFLEQP